MGLILFYSLISSSFIVSDYCYTEEMQHALEMHKTGKAHVIPILLRPVDLQGTPIAELQMLPEGLKPIVSWPDRDDALENVARGIRKVVDTLIARTSQPLVLSEEPQGKTLETIDSIEQYLEKLQAFLSKLPDYYPPQQIFDFTRVRQKVRLSTQRLLSYQLEKRSNAIKRPIISLREDEEGSQQRAVEQTYMHKSDINEEATLLDWEKLRKRQRRAVILGDPGLGKSWLLKYEGYLTVQEQRAILQ
jgi:hypothetical protein